MGQFSITVRSGVAEETAAALDDLWSKLSPEELDCQCAFVFFGARHDAHTIWTSLRAHLPNAAIIGGSSNGGAVEADGCMGPAAISLLLIHDPDGDYGAVCKPLGDQPAAAAEDALKAAIEEAGCAGELPDAVWVYQTPGREEDVLEGLRRVVGDRCPIVGGSSADDDLSGAWSQMATNSIAADGVAVAALFSSGRMEVVFQGGYEPAGPSGIVTDLCPDTASGRCISTIDNRPATEVYNMWAENRLAAYLETGGNVLADTTRYPLSKYIGTQNDVPQYLLIHPETFTETGKLTTFAKVLEGDRLVYMTGDPSRLVARAGSVGEMACALHPSTDTPAGAIVVFCAGCRMAIGAQEADLPASISGGVSGAPFLACFTFGEQGPLLGQNRHGNLMTSALVFWP